MLNICGTATNLDGDRFEAPVMNIVSFTENLELLLKRLSFKLKQGGSKNTGRLEFSSLEHDSDEDLDTVRCQVAELEKILKQLSKAPEHFSVTGCRKQLQQINLLRDFDKLLVEQQSDFDHLMNDINSIHNFILSTRHHDLNERLDSVTNLDNHNLTLSSRQKTIHRSKLNFASQYIEKPEFHVDSTKEHRSWARFKRRERPRKPSLDKSFQRDRTLFDEIIQNNHSSSRSCESKFIIRPRESLLTVEDSENFNFCKRAGWKHKESEKIKSLWLYTTGG